MTLLNKFGWQKIGRKPPRMQGKYYTLRKWQQEAFFALKDKRYIIINAPTGSGKTLSMEAISWAKMKENKSLRVAIAAPQTTIVNNFAEKYFVLPGTQEKVDWVPNNNLCHEVSENTIRSAIEWLESPRPFPLDQICLATNATWVACYQRLKTQGKLHLFNNLLFWADEGHHIQSSAWEIEEESVIVSNGMGELVHCLSVAEQKRNIHVGIASATLFRGDRLSLLAGEALERFNGEDGGRFDLSWDRYLQEMIYLKDFRVDFILCGSDYIPGIKGILEEAKRKDIIYIPHPSSKFSTGEKYVEAESIVECYQEVYGGKRQSLEGLEVIIREPEKDETIILNLVDEDERAKKKAYIRQEINKDRNTLNAIIAINMFKEGADWIYADRSIVVGSRNSPVDITQMNGRLFRDVDEHKKEVRVVYLLPFSLDRLKLTEEEFVANLNEFVRFIMSSMLLQEIMQPVQIKAPANNKSKQHGSRPPSAFDDLTTDQQVALRKNCGDFLVNLAMSGQKFENGDAWEIYESMMPTLLKKSGIAVPAQDQVEEIAKKVWASLARKTFADKGIDLSDVPFDVVKRTNPLNFLLRYTTDACDIKTWLELKEALHATGKIPTPVQRVEEVASVDGELPEEIKEMVRRLL